MFVGINACIFETEPCSPALTFTVSSGLVNYLGTHELCLCVLILPFIDGREFRQNNDPSQTLMNVRYIIVS